MIGKTYIRTWLLALLAISTAGASAQNDKPTVVTVPPLYEGALHSMSANGQWAVGYAANPENSSYAAFPRLVDAETGTVVELFTPQEGEQNLMISAKCVTNDGTLVGGSYLGMPSIWKESEGWVILPFPDESCTSGEVTAITPDGRYAVGRIWEDIFKEYPCMWEIPTMKVEPLPGMVDSNPRYQDMIDRGDNPAEWTPDLLNIRLTGISPDGNLLLGTVDFIYPDVTWQFVYNCSSASWTPVGMHYEGGRLIPAAEDIASVEECVLSADGSVIGGTYLSNDNMQIPFTCNPANPTAIATSVDGGGFGVWAVGSDGVIYGSTPVSTPVRNWSAYVGKYWYDWKQALRQTYGTDWQTDVTKDELGLSGTVVSVSADNRRILASDYAQNISYIITLPEPMAAICEMVDLLADYKAFPPQGAQFSTLQTITLDFGRDIRVLCEKTDATLTDADGKALRASINIATQAANSHKLEVIFRNFALEPGKTYKVEIPAGAICIADDSERTSKAITLTYSGREAGPVRPTSISPADGSGVARINLSTNPVTVTFNANLTPGEQPQIDFYQIKEGVEEYLFPLNASVDSNRMIIYPVVEQRLANGTDYRIKVAASTVTDLSGDGGNEEFSIIYHGTYVPEIDPSSNVVYSNDFSSGLTGILLLDGDGNTPSEAMSAWGFDNLNTPWMPVLDDDDTTGDYAAASHSSYDPAGRSDDWMVTPQLFLPDDKAHLSFKAQGYKNAKTDVLKVLVWESNDVMTMLTKSTADKIRYNGDLVFNQRVTPGDSEEHLLGDWTSFRIDLSKYAGKYVYIAFLNDNQNQSAIFVDDVLVSRETAALLSIDTETTLVNEDNTVIKGRFLVTHEDGINGYNLTLADAEGNVLATAATDTYIEKGMTVEFTFPDAVNLEKGAVNSYCVTLEAAGETMKANLDIRNLLFKTSKRTVIEEMTGTTCQFCPQGIIAIEYLQELFGDAVIPVAIHSYTGDSFGGAEQTAYSNFLGLSAAPTASIGRGPVSKPMWDSGSDYIFTAPDGNTWLQKTEESLSQLPIANFSVTNAVADVAGKRLTADFTADFALGLAEANINIFGIVMEDGLKGYQTNGLFNTEAPGLGEWGKGGEFAKARVPWFYDDVVRGTSAFTTAGSYSGFNGNGGYIPSSVNGGDTVTDTFEMALPSGISDMNSLKVCLMLIDANTGEFINAAVASCSTTSAGTVAADALRADVYDITGRLVLRAATIEEMRDLPSGLYIRDGRKHLIGSK